MKKIIATFMIAVIVLTATACSPSSESDSSGAVTTSPAEASLFGKVKNIVGNEIELEIADPPFDLGAGDIGDSSSVEMKEFIWNGDTELPEGLEDGVEGEVDSETHSATIIAITGEDGQTQVIGGDDMEKMELKYTGETKSIIIPAGTEILNLIGGSGLLDDIKKGSVLMIGIDDETASLPKATTVMIME